MLKIADYELLKYEHIDDWVKTIKEDYLKEDIDWGSYYEVNLQNLRFKCAYSDREMRGIVRTSIDIIRELIDIIDNGYTRERFDAADKKYSGDEYTIASVYSAFIDFKTDRLIQLIETMSDYTRVGGAYFMILSAPYMINTIYCVFERMLEDSDDEGMWFAEVYFMIRGAMKMHSEELPAEEQVEA